VLVCGCGQDAPIGRHDFDRDERVDGEAVLARQPADSAAQGQAGDADRPGVAERHGHTVLGQRGCDLAGSQAGAGPHGPTVQIDVEAAEVARIEDENAVASAVPGEAVAAGANREIEAVATGEVDCR
jgi:hypothetical protein